VNREINLAEDRLNGAEGGVEIGVFLDVAGDEKPGPDRLNELADLVFVLRACGVLIGKMGEPHLGPFGSQFLRNRPGD
jgi:hypothetical protein